jgi:hypothetical protein
VLRCIIPLSCIIQQNVYGLIRCITCSRRNINREANDGGRSGYIVAPSSNSNFFRIKVYSDERE